MQKIFFQNKSYDPFTMIVFWDGPGFYINAYEKENGILVHIIRPLENISNIEDIIKTYHDLGMPIVFKNIKHMLREMNKSGFKRIK